MKATRIASADQVVPISKARANLSQLVDSAHERNFWLISRKYEPQAALVDLEFMNKLLSAYSKWQREQDLAELEEIWARTPDYPSEEIEADIEEAIRHVRSTAKSRS